MDNSVWQRLIHFFVLVLDIFSWIVAFHINIVEVFVFTSLKVLNMMSHIVLIDIVAWRGLDVLLRNYDFLLMNFVFVNFQISDAHFLAFSDGRSENQVQSLSLHRHFLLLSNILFLQVATGLVGQMVQLNSFLFFLLGIILKLGI